MSYMSDKEFKAKMKEIQRDNEGIVFEKAMLKESASSVTNSSSSNTVSDESTSNKNNSESKSWIN